jgi:hypothetical protein
LIRFTVHLYAFFFNALEFKVGLFPVQMATEGWLLQGLRRETNESIHIRTRNTARRCDSDFRAGKTARSLRSALCLPLSRNTANPVNWATPLFHGTGKIVLL